MRRPRVWVRTGSEGDVVQVGDEEARHVVDVLRRRAGDGIVVVTGDGACYEARLARVERGAGGGPRVWVALEAAISEPPPPVLPWTVAAALVKGRGMDLAVRSCAELGIGTLIPLVTERRAVLPRRPGRPERWARIAREAQKQCGRAAPLGVSEPRTVPEVLAAREPGAAAWVLHPGARLIDPSELALADGPAPALFLVGPEGGFSSSELAVAEESGARVVGFPTPVLRTPTAVVLIAALGVLVRGAARAGSSGKDSG